MSQFMYTNPATVSPLFYDNVDVTRSIGVTPQIQANCSNSSTGSDMVLKIIGMILLWLVMLFFFSFIILALWNGVIPNLFPGARPMTLSVAVGFSFLVFFIGSIFNNGKLFGLNLRGPWSKSQ